MWTALCILTVIFLATGRGPARNVESSNCMTLMEPYVTVTWIYDAMVMCKQS